MYWHGGRSCLHLGQRTAAAGKSMPPPPEKLSAFANRLCSSGRGFRRLIASHASVYVSYSGFEIDLKGEVVCHNCK